MIWIGVDPDQCPTDPAAMAEAYLVDRLAPEEARTFEDHYITCDRCARIVEEVDACIVVMRGAARNGE